MSEGFATAWEDTGDDDVGATMITLKMNNLPEGVNLRWPHVVEFLDPNADATANDWSSSHPDRCIPSNSRNPLMTDCWGYGGAGKTIQAPTDGDNRCQQRRDGHLRVHY